MTKKKKLTKPKRKAVSEPVLIYSEASEYIEAKYWCDLRNYGNKYRYDGNESQDFWHWLIDRTDLGNGKFIYIPVRYYYRWDVKTKTDVYTPVKGEEWIEEILMMFRDEFCTKDDMDGLKVWIEW